MASTKKKSAEADPLVALADDAEVADLRLTDYPIGTPRFVPYLKLRPFSKRARFKRKFGELEHIKNRVDELRKAGTLTNLEQAPMSVQIQVSAELDEMYQYLDELLEIVAEDPVAYRQWVDGLADGDSLTKVFNFYIRIGQVGEASSSAT